jgi:hypothetical protein
MSALKPFLYNGSEISVGVRVKMLSALETILFPKSPLAPVTTILFFCKCTALQPPDPILGVIDLNFSFPYQEMAANIEILVITMRGMKSGSKHPS